MSDENSSITLSQKTSSLAALMLALPLQAGATVLFTTDQAFWNSLARGEQSYEFTADNVEKANQVTRNLSGTQNQFLLGGPSNSGGFEVGKLTFDSANTGLSSTFDFESTQSGSNSGFTWNDCESSCLTNFQNALSLGDINNRENDDWEITFISGADIFAFAFDLEDNNSNSGESFSVFGASGLLGTTTIIPTLGTNSGNTFLGAISWNEAITKVSFDEDSGGDDIAVSAIYIATAVPAPATLALLGLGLAGLGWSRRKKA